MVIRLRCGDDGQVKLCAKQAIAHCFGQTFTQFESHTWKTPDERRRESCVEDVGKARWCTEPHRSAWVAVLRPRLGLDVFDGSQQPTSPRQQHLAGLGYRDA